MKHDIVLCEKRDNHRWILAALGFVYGNCVGQNKLIQFTPVVVHKAIFELDLGFLLFKRIFQNSFSMLYVH